MLLGHASVQTTERYLGTKQDLVHAPNDGDQAEARSVTPLVQRFLNLRRKSFRVSIASKASLEDKRPPRSE